MIRALYRASVREYEKGWGNRPDGYIYAQTKELIELAVKNVEDIGCLDCFYRCGAIMLVEIEDDKLYNLVLENKNKGYVWTN